MSSTGWLANGKSLAIRSDFAINARENRIFGNLPACPCPGESFTVLNSCLLGGPDLAA